MCNGIYYLLLEVPSSAVNTCCLFRNAWYMCYSAIDVWGTPQPNIKTPKYWGLKKSFLQEHYQKVIIRQ